MLGIKKLFCKCFETREIILVSNTKIASKKVGKVFYILSAFIFAWIIFSSVKYFEYREVIKNKNKTLEELWNTNANLKEDLNTFDASIFALKNYIASLNKYDRFSTIIADDESVDNYLNRMNKHLSDKYLKDAVAVLERSTNNTQEIASYLDKRINGIEDLIRKTGIKNSPDYFYLASDEDEGPRADITIDKNGLVDKSIVRKLETKISYLAYLEQFLDKLPIGEPLDSYFISSKYGVRGDPFTGDPRPHMALDMVGPLDSKVYAPSTATVVATGNIKGYGNYLILDHGSGMRTEYAHMQKVLVKEKQKLKRGDILGIQGSTGRSTGQHVHYVVKQDGSPLNPENFLKVGKEVF